MMKLTKFQAHLFDCHSNQDHIQTDKIETIQAGDLLCTLSLK